MICQRIGRPPISTIGLGFNCVSSERRLPTPPARMATLIFIMLGSSMVWAILHDRYSRSDAGTPKGAGSRAWYSKTLKVIVDRFSAEAHLSAAIGSLLSFLERQG